MFLLAIAVVGWLARGAAAQGTVYTVNSIADPGTGGCDASECTLREAILGANADPGADRIEFAIAGSGPHTVRPSAPLPIVTDPVTIDGYTQPGARPNAAPDVHDGVLVIEIEGSGAGGHGLEIVTTGSVVRGLVINGFSDAGILIRSGSNNRIEGSFIGVNATGTEERPNGQDGIAIIDSPANLIGGSSPAARNLLSGNLDAGIAILNGGSFNNRVLGNFVGVGATGGALGNGEDGVLVSAVEGVTDYATDNMIGGTASGDRNVISGNVRSGVQIFRGGGNQVSGNFVGTDADGVAPVPNGDGILIIEASDNVVGGTDPGAGNLISGNQHAGIQLYTVERVASGNLIQGNRIGIDRLGLEPLGNEVGVLFQTFGHTTQPLTLNTIGGTDADDGTPDAVVRARNVIAANRDTGVSLVGHKTIGNDVFGNLIGTNPTGNAGLGNGGIGVLVTSSNTGGGGAQENRIGDVAAGARNVISGNGSDGIQIGFVSNATRVVGNFIGTTPAGDATLGNGRHGVAVFDSSLNRIGGSAGDALNLIAGNGGNGVLISEGAAGERTEDNEVLGNYIGLGIDGTTALGNGTSGVRIHEAPENRIGGASAGEGNVMSGNGGFGVEVQGNRSRKTEIAGNRIGTDELGLAAVPNESGGVWIAAPETVLGLAVSGGGNVISGNDGWGVRVSGASCVPGDPCGPNAIMNNLVGAGADGVTDVGNDFEGIYVSVLSVDPSSSPQTHIGGVEPGLPQGNVIAFNGPETSHRFLFGGIRTNSDTTTMIRRNSIFANSGKGIVLLEGAPLFNDVAVVGGTPVFDGDDGPNGLQNSPEVTDVRFTDDTVTVEWTLSSAPSSTYVIDFFANSSPDASGFGAAERFLRSRLVSTDTEGRAVFTESFAREEATYLSTTATDPAGNTSELSIVDTDADGLADAWETDGIEIVDDLNVDMLLPGADPNHKDLYVEIDAMEGFGPLTGELEDLVNTFAAAPADLVQNPDGTAGISLHLELDETDIPAQPWTGDLDGDGVPALGSDRNGDGVVDPGDPDDQGGWAWFDVVKSARFGTAAQRGAADATNAKHLAYRYALFADRYVERRGTQETTGSSGRAEYWRWASGASAGGNDFFVTLGTWGADSDDYAGTFMHELGHTLKLGHGGDDDVNFKPNYFSVMNYVWQAPHAAFGPGSSCPSWQLGYSTRERLALNESALDESAGFGGSASRCVPVGPATDAAGDPTPLSLLAEGGSVDINGDGDTTDTAVARDLNFLDAGGAASPGETLSGFEDWSNLQLGFRTAPGVAPGVHPLEPDGEITLEQNEMLDAVGRGPGELQLSQETYDVIEGAGHVRVRVTRSGGTDGTVTVDLSTADITATAGADYGATSTTVTLESGQHAREATVPILDDDTPEIPETIRVALSNATGGATLGARSTTEVRLVDDDSILVLNTNDDGYGSLRRAIELGNAIPGHDVILFSIPGTGAQTIRPASRLPAATGPLTIDGYSQPGARPNSLAVGNDANLLITIDASDVGSAPALEIGGQASVVRGLAIVRSPRYGIEVMSTAHRSRIEGNFLGIEVDGATPAGNLVGVRSLANDVVVGGTDPAARNVISGNGRIGVLSTFTARRTVIQGNYIGTDRHGQSAVGNVTEGVMIGGGGSFPISPDSVVGGTEPGAGNLISGNARGVFVIRTRGTSILGNLIGTNADGSRAIGNSTGIDDNGGVDTVIGGPAPGAGNVITGSNRWNVVLGDSIGTRGSATIQGNFIGTDRTGVRALTAGDREGDGIFVIGSRPGTVIGGSAPAEKNVISGHRGFGVRLGGTAQPTSLVVRGNLIGVQSDGVSPLGNGRSGIWLMNGAVGNEIASNTIAFNGGDGVLIERFSTGNNLWENRIYSNAELGIDLGDDGPSSNDEADADEGANLGQNYPVLTSVSVDGEETMIEGSLASKPSSSFQVELFSSEETDPSGFGEGAAHIGTVEVITDAGGTGVFSLVLPYSLAVGTYVTGTATDATGNTSEFSAALHVDFAPTRLEAEPVIARVGSTPSVMFPEVAATLTSERGGTPLEGRLIHFRAGDTAICAAVTDADGRASCRDVTAGLATLTNLGYTATFEGDAYHAPASAAGSLAEVD